MKCIIISNLICLGGGILIGIYREPIYNFVKEKTSWLFKKIFNKK